VRAKEKQKTQSVIPFSSLFLQTPVLVFPRINHERCPSTLPSASFRLSLRPPLWADAAGGFCRPHAAISLHGRRHLATCISHLPCHLPFAICNRPPSTVHRLPLVPRKKFPINQKIKNHIYILGTLRPFRALEFKKSKGPILSAIRATRT
jgi:hypothetical protein